MAQKEKMIKRLESDYWELYNIKSKGRKPLAFNDVNLLHYMIVNETDEKAIDFLFEKIANKYMPYFKKQLIGSSKSVCDELMSDYFVAVYNAIVSFRGYNNKTNDKAQFSTWLFKCIQLVTKIYFRDKKEVIAYNDNILYEDDNF